MYQRPSNEEPMAKFQETSVGVASEPRLSAAAEWRRALLLAFVGLPIVTLLAVCAYGFIIWFMQILFWGPPQ